MISPDGLQASAPRRCDRSLSNRVHGPMHVPITEKEAMKVSLKKPMSRLLAGAIACALPLVAGATDTQYSSNFQPIVERVRCWIVSKPIEGNCQLVDRRRSSFVGGANLMAHASDVDGNTVLDLGDHQLMLTGVSTAMLHQDDFLLS
jgi:hypothetical protein